MTLTFTPHHPLFVAEASPISLRDTHDEATLAEIRAGMDRFGVLVFRDQQFSEKKRWPSASDWMANCIPRPVSPP